MVTREILNKNYPKNIFYSFFIKKFLKLEKQKSNQFFSLKIQIFWHTEEIFSNFGRSAGVGIKTHTHT